MTCIDSHAHATAPCTFQHMNLLHACTFSTCNCSMHIQQLYSLRLAPERSAFVSFNLNAIIIVWAYNYTGYTIDTPTPHHYILFTFYTAGRTLIQLRSCQFVLSKKNKRELNSLFDCSQEATRVAFRPLILKWEDSSAGPTLGAESSCSIPMQVAAGTLAPKRDHKW